MWKNPYKVDFVWAGMKFWYGGEKNLFSGGFLSEGFQNCRQVDTVFKRREQDESNCNRGEIKIMSIENGTTLEDNSSTENTYLEEESNILEEDGSILAEDGNNQTMENEKMVPWQMFRHAIEQVGLLLF